MKKFLSTTRGSFRRTSSTKQRYRLWAYTGAVALVLFFVAPWFVARLASIVVVPIETVQTWLSESNARLPLYLRDRSALVEENRLLQNELIQRTAEPGTLAAVVAENTQLRALLGVAPEERIAAGVIGRPDTLPYDVLMVDAGAEQGVVVGAPVYAGANVVIGSVAHVFPRTALVKLVTSPGVSSSVFIVGPDIYTTATGIGGGQLRVGVPQGISLTIGDPVILPSLKSGIYGTINHIESLPTRPEQYAYVAPALPLSGIQIVAIGRSAMTPVSFEEAQTIVKDVALEAFGVPVPEGVLVLPVGATSTATTSIINTESATSTAQE